MPANRKPASKTTSYLYRCTERSILIGPKVLIYFLLQHSSDSSFDCEVCITALFLVRYHLLARNKP